MPGINPHPWQTDTSIGDWYYNKNWKFRPVSWTIHMLVDIVSKNGNLLLNVVQRPDGSLDPEVEQALSELADWIAVHGEAIYETRPWLVYGEGGVRYKGGHFAEDFRYTAQRYPLHHQRSDLYAIAMGWPEDGKLLVRSLATPAGKVAAVSVLGVRGKSHVAADSRRLGCHRSDPPGFSIHVCTQDRGRQPQAGTDPRSLPRGQSRRAREFTAAAGGRQPARRPNQDRRARGAPNIGFWDNAADWACWQVKVEKPGGVCSQRHLRHATCRCAVRGRSGGSTA